MFPIKTPFFAAHHAEMQVLLSGSSVLQPEHGPVGAAFGTSFRRSRRMNARKRGRRDRR